MFISFMLRSPRWLLAALFASLAFGFVVSYANAQSSPLLNPGAMPTTGDFKVGTLITNLQNAGQQLTGAATVVFIACAVLEFVWMVTMAVISGRTVGELIGQWVPKMIGFSLLFYFLVLHGADTASVIISSFMAAAGFTSGVSPTTYSPTGLMATGLGLIWPMLLYAIGFAAIPNVWSAFFFTFGISNLQVPVIAIQVLGATITMGAYTFLGGTLLITIIECYLVSTLGILLAGFAPLRTTHAMGSQRVLGYAISVGVKLLVLYLTIGVIQTVLNGIIAGAAAIPFVGAIIVAFYAVILALVAYNIPAFASTIVSGMAGAAAGAGVQAFSGSLAVASSMAQSAHSISDGMHKQNESKEVKKEDKTLQDRHAGSAPKDDKPNASTPTSLGAVSQETGQHSLGAETNNASATAAGSPSPQTSQNQPNGAQGAASLAQSAPGTNVLAANEMPTAASLPSNGSQQNPRGTELSGSNAPGAGSYSLPKARGSGAEAATPPVSALSNEEVGSETDRRDTATIRKDLEQRLASDNLSKDDRKMLDDRLVGTALKQANDGMEEMRKGIDGLGKSLEQFLSPNGASSAAGAVAGASLRSSI
jgi:type IV secretion system protein TrbL